MAGLKPDMAVVVATVRALKYNGGIAKDQLKAENVEGTAKGAAKPAKTYRKYAEVWSSGRRCA